MHEPTLFGLCAVSSWKPIVVQNQPLVGVLLFGLLMLLGCADTEDTGGRVALQVSVTIDGKRAGNGTLVLRPLPGVQSPLIKVPVSSGGGVVGQSQGPVPGKYFAQFRETGGEMNLSEYLSETGRVDPYVEKRSEQRSRRAISTAVKAQIKPTEVVVPNKNPANVEVQLTTQ